MKVSLLDQAKELVAKKWGRYRIARELNVSERTAMNLIKKAKEEYCPSLDSLKLTVAEGTTFVKLANKFGFKTPEEAVIAIEEVFQGDEYLIHETDLPNGDIQYVIIPDHNNKHSWLVAKEKPFHYFISPENNYLYVDLDPSLPDEIKIYNLTDLHIGSKHCREELLRSHVQMIADDPSALALLGGDIFNFNTKLSVGQPFDDKLAPMEQVMRAVDILKPIAHKIIYYVAGNHDRGRGFKHIGVDLAEVLANYLQAPYGFMETVIDINHKGNTFTAVFHHGSGKGGSVQAILGEAESYRKHVSFPVHFHLSGHVHQAFILPRNCTIKTIGKGLSHQRYFTIIGGSYEARSGTYSEESKFVPSCQDLQYMILRADGDYDASSVKIDCL